PKIEDFELTQDGPDSNAYRANLTGERLETIEEAGWSVDQPQPVTGMPLPSGAGSQQVLSFKLAIPPDPDATLYVWLRGESKPRVTKIHPRMPIPVN
ncbi:MAG TPA: hypothetical protein VFW83_00610, partial [Bryobacteraceae bacterium]|nr:hypothetical protein [Bryobacteraceae bacterium]